MSSFEELEQFELSFLSNLVDIFKLRYITNEYCKKIIEALNLVYFKGDCLEKLYILVDGDLRDFRASGDCPKVSVATVINGDQLGLMRNSMTAQNTVFAI